MTDKQKTHNDRLWLKLKKQILQSIQAARLRTGEPAPWEKPERLPK